MRLSIKTKQVAGVVLIVGLAVVILSAIHLAWITRIHLRESLSRGEMVAQFVFERASGVVTTREQAYSALQGDPGLRSLLLSSIAYSEHVTSAAIVDPRNVAIVHSSPTLEGQVLEPQPLLKNLLDQGPLDQFQAITGDRTFEVQQPLLMRREPTPAPAAAPAGAAGGAGAGGTGGAVVAGLRELWRQVRNCWSCGNGWRPRRTLPRARRRQAGGGTEQFGSIRVGVSDDADQARSAAGVVELGDHGVHLADCGDGRRAAAGAVDAASGARVEERIEPAGARRIRRQAGSAARRRIRRAWRFVQPVERGIVGRAIAVGGGSGGAVRVGGRSARRRGGDVQSGRAVAVRERGDAQRAAGVVVWRQSARGAGAGASVSHAGRAGAAVAALAGTGVAGGAGAGRGGRHRAVADGARDRARRSPFPRRDARGAQPRVSRAGAVDAALLAQARVAQPSAGGRRARGEESAERDDDPPRAAQAEVERRRGGVRGGRASVAGDGSGRGRRRRAAGRARAGRRRRAGGSGRERRAAVAARR